MTQPLSLPSQERLQELFDYCPSTGILSWKVSRGNGAQIGRPCGSPGQNYLHFNLEGRTLQVHRVVWKWVTGKEPGRTIDHIDHDRHNNKWENLREADYNQQKRNQHHSGYRVAVSGRFTAQIYVKGKRLGLGTYGTPEEATSVYQTAHKHYFGDFSPYQ